MRRWLATRRKTENVKTSVVKNGLATKLLMLHVTTRMCNRLTKRMDRLDVRLTPGKCIELCETIWTWLWWSISILLSSVDCCRLSALCCWVRKNNNILRSYTSVFFVILFHLLPENNTRYTVRQRADRTKTEYRDRVKNVRINNAIDVQLTHTHQ